MNCDSAGEQLYDIVFNVVAKATSTQLARGPGLRLGQLERRSRRVCAVLALDEIDALAKLARKGGVHLRQGIAPARHAGAAVEADHAGGPPLVSDGRREGVHRRAAVGLAAAATADSGGIGAGGDHCGDAAGIRAGDGDAGTGVCDEADLDVGHVRVRVDVDRAPIIGAEDEGVALREWERRSWGG